jgi:hypothetical protein
MATHAGQFFSGSVTTVAEIEQFAVCHGSGDDDDFGLRGRVDRVLTLIGY